MVGWLPRTAAAMKWSCPGLMRKIMCVVDVRTKEVELPKSLGTQKITSDYQMGDTEIFTLLDFIFALI